MAHEQEHIRQFEHAFDVAMGTYIRYFNKDASLFRTEIEAETALRRIDARGESTTLEGMIVDATVNLYPPAPGYGDVGVGEEEGKEVEQMYLLWLYGLGE